MPGLSVLIVLLVVWVIVFAPLAGWLARERARPWVAWGLFGAVLGPAAAALLVMAPPGRCPVCGIRIVGWPQVCQTCGRDLHSQPIEIARENAARRASMISSPIDSIGGPSLDLGQTTSLRSREEAPPPARPATALGLRPPAVSAPLPPSSQLAALRLEPEGGPGILGSGVFVGGNESLQVGSRYLFARVGDDLHALGPVHVSPGTIAARVPLVGVEPSIVDDRLLLTPAEPGRGPELAFGGVRLEQDVDIVNVLSAGMADVDAAERPTPVRREPIVERKSAGSVGMTIRLRSRFQRKSGAHRAATARRSSLSVQAGPYTLRARHVIFMALSAGLVASAIVALIGR